MLADPITLRGELEVVLRDKRGRIKARRKVKNLITTTGRANIVEQLVASPAASTKPTHMEVGTSGTAAAVGDTTITGGFGRVALTTLTRATNVLTAVGNFAAGVSTGTLQEAGLWPVVSGGTALLSRATFTSIVKGASDTLQVTWTWTIG